MGAATVAVIPSRGADIEALLELVLPDVDHAIVIDLVGGLRDRDGVRVLRRDPRASLYRWLNEGWRLAREVASEVNVAVLDDAVRILPGTVAHLSRALRVRDDVGMVYPDDRLDVVRAKLPPRVRLDIDRDPLGGRIVTGYCFVARAELPIEGPFDEGYLRWYGDTQFDEAVRLVGYGVARVLGVPVGPPEWRPIREDEEEADGRRFDSLHVRVLNGQWWPVCERYVG